MSSGIATVSTTGLVQGVRVGTARIRATSGTATDYSTVLVSGTVTPPPPGPAPVATVTMNPTSGALQVGQSMTFTATPRDSSGNAVSGRTITWSSASPAVATVNASGAVTGVTQGSTTVRATIDGRIGSAPMTVTNAPPPPPTGSSFFSSNWSAATGNNSSALTDGGKWEWLCCDMPSPLMSVIAGGSVGWTRSTNVLRIQQLGERGSQLAAPALPQSTTHWGRFYFRNDETRTWHQHPTSYNAIGNIQGIPWTRWGKAGGVEIGAKLFGHGYPYEQWQPATLLQNGAWYRYEWQVEFVTASTYRLWPRVYDMAGNLVLDADDYKRADWTGSGHSLQSFQDAGNVFTFSSPSLARRFGLGNEGPAGATAMTGYWYIANMALSTTGWLGQ